MTRFEHLMVTWKSLDKLVSQFVVVMNTEIGPTREEYDAVQDVLFQLRVDIYRAAYRLSNEALTVECTPSDIQSLLVKAAINP